MTESQTITLTALDGASRGAVSVDIPRRLGSVELKSEIGRGGTGVVYRGYDAILARDVAVKFLFHSSPEGADQTFRDFIEGARAAAKVRHPGICPLYNADVIGGVPYLVMEYVNGPTLSDVIRRNGALDWPAAAAILKDTAEAVAELHEHGILHRDIKPANVLLDGDGRVLVTDFGMALVRSLPGTTRVRISGTPAYMAPEAFDGVVSERSDVYSLGMTAFHLLAGAAPFSGSIDEIGRRHAEEPLPVELLESRGIPKQVCDVLARACHKNPMFRYKSGGHFLRAFAETTDGDAIAAGRKRLAQLVTDKSELRAGEPVATAPTTPSSSYFEQLSNLAQIKRGSHSIESNPMTAPSESSPTKTEQLILVDLPCFTCGYNLRMQRMADLCPECASPIRKSIDPQRLHFADPNWLLRLRRGHRRLLLSMPVGMAAGFLWLAVTDIWPIGAYIDTGFLGVGIVACYVLYITHWVFLSTSHETANIEPDKANRLRIIARAGYGIFMISKLYDFTCVIFAPELRFPHKIQIWVEVAFLASGFVAALSWLEFQKTIAARIPKPNLMRRALVTQILIGMCAAITLPLQLYSASVTGPANWNARLHEVPVWSIWVGGLAIIGSVCAAIATSLLAAGLLDALRRVAAEHVDLKALHGDRPSAAPRENG